MHEEQNTVPRVGGGQNLGRQHDLTKSKGANHHKPDPHHRTEDLADAGGAVLLEEEKGGDDRDGERQHQVLRLRRNHLQPFDGAQYGDRRSDYAIAVEKSRADQSERDDRLASERVGIASLLLENEREQREDSALAVVVGAHDENDVLDADDDDQRPDDEREDPVDVSRNRSQSMLYLEALAQRIQGAGADVSVDNAQREECEFCETAAARTSFEVSADLRD